MNLRARSSLKKIPVVILSPLNRTIFSQSPYPPPYFELCFSIKLRITYSCGLYGSSAASKSLILHGKLRQVKLLPCVLLRLDVTR
jgi:hypothetical protein